MCRSTVQGGRRCPAHQDTRSASRQRAERRTRVRARIGALPAASLRELADSLAEGTGHAERDAALAEANARSMLADWWTLTDSADPADRLSAARLPCDDSRAEPGYSQLALNYDPAIRRALAQNPATSVQVISDLAHDPDAAVRARAEALLAERGVHASPASPEARAFHDRMAVTLDDAPHADVTRAAMTRPGWIAPHDAEPELQRVAAEHGARIVLHPGTIPGATGVVEVHEIRVNSDARGRGAGTAAMRAVNALADRHGWTLALHPSGDLGSDVERLQGWYRREGFEPLEAGTDKRVRLNLADWVRYPREVQADTVAA